MHRVASSDGITIAVHELSGAAGGPAGDRRPLLMCHATGFCGSLWAPVARHLPGYRCLAPDLRGHGRSPAPDDHPFDWHGFADDVLAVVDALDLAGCAGVGHSKGGAALLLAEERRPGTFRALWCYEPIVFPGPPIRSGDNPLAEAARRRKTTFPSRRAAVENFRSKPPLDVFTDEALDAYVEGGFAEHADGSLSIRCAPEHEARVFEMGSQHGAFGRLADVACPVTIVRGRFEPGPAQFAAAVAAALPHGRVEVHDDLGHFGPQQDPERMAMSIRRALTPA